MEEQVLKKLRKIVGKDDVFDSHLDVTCYSRDRLPWASNKRWAAEKIEKPSVIVRPETTEEVVGIVKLANEQKIPILARGAGTGFMGAAVAVKKGSILLDMRKMDRILEINDNDRKVVVQPGINLNRLDDQLIPYDMIVGHDPGSGPSSTIGGGMSQDGTGAMCNKVGTFRDMVRGVTVVLPNGEVLKTNDASKSAIGYNLRYLFIGAEGTLGIMTEVSLNCKPRGAMRLGCWEFKTFMDAYNAMDKLGKADLIPARISLQDEGRSGSLTRATGRTIKASITTCFLENEQLLDLKYDLVKKTLEGAGGTTLPQEVCDYWWETRHDYPQAEGVWQVLETCVPWSRVPEAYEGALEIFKKHNYTKSESMGCFAYNPTPWSIDLYFDENDEADMNKVLEMEHEIRRMSYRLGGSMSSCHGIGMFMPDLAKEELGYSLEVMKWIKKAFDPNNIMNPGKLGLDE